MGFRLVKIELVPGGLTEKELEKFLELPSIPGERDVKKGHMKWMRNLAVAGKFNRCDWAVCYCKENKKWYRINGQHSKTMLEEIRAGTLDAIFPKGVPIAKQFWESDRVTDLPDVFDQVDSHKSTRTPDDKLGVFLKQHEDMTGIPKKFANAMLTGVEWGCKNIASVTEACEGMELPTEAYDRGVLMNWDKVREFLCMINEYSNAPFKEWKQRSGMVAEFFRMFLINPADAEDIIGQTLYEVGDATAKFTKKIRDSSAKIGKDAGWYYRQTVAFCESALRELQGMDREEFKRKMRELIDENGATAEENADELEEAVS
jgi:hypothetical protein